MQGKLFITLMLLAASASGSLIQRLQCYRLLAPRPADLEAYLSSMVSCLRQDDILQPFLQALRENVGNFDVSELMSLDTSELLSSEGDKFAAVLDFLNLSDEVTALRRCMAEKVGKLTADGEFDTASFSESILDKVEGTSVEENVQRGVENCGEVQNFKVYLYLECIQDHCTGEL